VVASTEDVTSELFSVSAPSLASLPSGAATVDHGGRRYFAVVAPVDGTSWRLVAAVPQHGLTTPARNSARTMWVLVLVTGALASAVLILINRSYRQRDHFDRLSRTDALTRLANRGQADAVLARTALACERSGRPWAVAMIDIDHFKAVNDRHGHAAGDRALRHVADTLALATRRTDHVARWGGEEFILVMPDTDPFAAVAVGERLASAIRETPTADGLQLTVSVGVAAGATACVSAVVATADRALYGAKDAGRDCVAILTPVDVEEFPEHEGAGVSA